MSNNRSTIKSNDDDDDSAATTATIKRDTIRKQIPHMTTRFRQLVSYGNPILWWRATVMKRRKLIVWNPYIDSTIVSLLLFVCSPTVVPSVFIGTGSFGWKTLLHRTTTGVVARDNTTTAMTKDQQSQKLNELTAIATTTATTNCLLLAYILYHISRATCSIVRSMYEIQQSRFMAHPMAYQCLYDRIRQHRAYRTYSYDVYLPPPKTLPEQLSRNHNHIFDTTTVDIAAIAEPANNSYSNSNEFILFLPGAYVEHVAYSQVAALLSDQGGYTVIVLSSEPLGIVDVHIPNFSTSKIRSIQREIERTFNNNDKNNHDSNSKTRWILMGHSMGSLTCTKLLSSKVLENISDIVMWGSAPFIDYMGDISQEEDDNNACSSSSRTNVLVVQGTKDEIIQSYCTPEMIHEFWNLLPPVVEDDVVHSKSSTITKTQRATTTLCEIVGGSHYGFGNYLSNNSNNNNNGIDDDVISISEQHRIAVRLTIEFLQRQNQQ